jgi:hypothetical protein
MLRILPWEAESYSTGQEVLLWKPKTHELTTWPNPETIQHSSHLDILVLQETFQYFPPIYVFCSPATRHGGACGERRYSSYSFTMSALDGGGWSVSRPGRALPPGKGPPVTIGEEAGWAPESVWTENGGKIHCLCRGSNPDRPVVQPVVRHYTVTC